MLITEAYHEAYSDCHGLVEMNRKQMAAEEDVNFSERTVYEAVNKLSGSTVPAGLKNHLQSAVNLKRNYWK